jgi:hypothetical protein
MLVIVMLNLSRQAVALCTLFLFLLVTGCSTEEPAEPAPADERDATFVDQDPGKADANGIQEHSFEGLCVLDLVNTADVDLLREEVGLTRWPAREIWAYRVGKDGVDGTEDDNPFDSLTELDDVSWVGYFTFRALRSYAKDNGYCPELGEERLMTGEEAATAEVTAASEDFINAKYAVERPARRDAHAKDHGCVTASFEVDNNLLDPAEKVGVFASNKSYPAWIRFSNGSFHVQGDVEADVRGFAIKLMEVEGDKVLAAQRDAQTQDFLLINGPKMFVRNPVDYVEFSQKALDGNPVSYFLKLDPRQWHLRELFNLLGIVRKKPSSPLNSQYWSTTPYRLGEDNAVKFSARPCDGEVDGRPDDPSEDYLREAMAEHLAGNDACFEFMVQRQLDPESMPIEDPTYEWEEGQSPFVVVARIKIPAQTFDTPGRQTFCENLSMNPWHTLPEHRPLGGINRVRRTVYEAISALRHELNEAPRREPKSHDISDF